MNTRREGTYRGLQALRFVAALLVLLTHASFYASERLRPGSGYWERGAVGVELFFVLSGFVMVYSSARLMDLAAGWRIFAERRLVRIVPMYWLATTLKLAMMLLTTGLVLHARFSPWKTLCSYLFLPARNIDGELRPLLSVGWTLNFEMFFYLLFAAALLLRRNLYWFLGTVLVALAAASTLVKPNWPAASFYLSPIVLDFLYGMLIARWTLRGIQPRLRLALPALALGIAFLLVVPDTHWRLPVLGLAAALVVWATVALEPHLTRIPRALLYLGDASYVLYLFHPMVAPLAPTILARLHLGSPLLSVGLSVALAVLVASGVHSFLELPATAFLKQRLRVHGQRFIHLPDKADQIITLPATAEEALRRSA